MIGGGRPNGNTAQLADAFIKGATEAGHQVEKVSLNKTEVKGCHGCNACRYGKPCIQKDGFHELVPKIRTCIHQIDKTGHLAKAYAFGKNIYQE